MNILGCLDKPTSGTYRVAGTDIAQLDGDALARLRREHFGFIFQRYHLLSHLTAAQNVEVRRCMPAVNGARAWRALMSCWCGWAGRARRLSTVTVVRRSAAAGQYRPRPDEWREVILADEPTGALDSHSGEEVMAILHQLKSAGAYGHHCDPRSAGRRFRRSGSSRSAMARSSATARQPPGRRTARPSAGGAFGVASVYQRLREALVMAWRAMAANKMRTPLTMLGIIIGIASVVSIVVVGMPPSRWCWRIFAPSAPIPLMCILVGDFGDDDPRYQQALKYDDLLAIQKQPWVRSATPAVSKACACAPTILTLPPARRGGRSTVF